MELQRQRQKREEENEVRKRQGKELLSLDDLAREFKLQNDPSRLESFVIANQIEGICDSIIRTTKESWSKTYAIKALQRSEGDAKQ